MPHSHKLMFILTYFAQASNCVSCLCFSFRYMGNIGTTWLLLLSLRYAADKTTLLHALPMQQFRGSKPRTGRNGRTSAYTSRRVLPAATADVRFSREDLSWSLHETLSEVGGVTLCEAWKCCQRVCWKQSFAESFKSWPDDGFVMLELVWGNSPACSTVGGPD